MSKRASANESTSAEEEAKEGEEEEGEEEGEDRVEEGAEEGEGAAAHRAVEFAAGLVLRLLVFVCAGLALVVAATPRGNLGEEARGHDAAHGRDDESDIGGEKRRRLVF